MQISLNGTPHTLKNATTISELLESLGLADKPVVVEHNKLALFPRDYVTTVLKHSDSLEIITIAAGG